MNFHINNIVYVLFRKKLIAIDNENEWSQVEYL